MVKTKYDFIKELLEDKKVNTNLREKILELSSKEFMHVGKIEAAGQNIEESKSKGLEGSRAKTTNTKTKNPTLNNLPHYLDPYHLYKFLFEYNQNPILRTTCHEIDANELKSILEFCKTESYNFRLHLKSIITAYKKHEKTYYAPRQIKTLITGYLIGKDTKGNDILWTENNIKINWSNINLLNWANESLNTPPNASTILLRERKVKSYKIEPQIKSPITEKVIQTFPQLVLHFKNLFHIKSGPQSLKEIIHRVNHEKGWQNLVEFKIENHDFSNNLEHFVDVEKLIQAYNKIIRIIIEEQRKDEKPIVKLKYNAEINKVSFSIHHLNGIYKKTIENTVERLGQSYTNLIKYQINGLCDLHLKADFDNKNYAEINLWNGLDRNCNKISHFVGVEHILEFPKISKP